MVLVPLKKKDLAIFFIFKIDTFFLIYPYDFQNVLFRQRGNGYHALLPSLQPNPQGFMKETAY